MRKRLFFFIYKYYYLYKIKVTLYKTGRATTSIAGYITKNINGYQVNFYGFINCTIS